MITINHVPSVSNASPMYTQYFSRKDFSGSGCIGSPFGESGGGTKSSGLRSGASFQIQASNTLDWKISHNGGETGNWKVNVVLVKETAVRCGAFWGQLPSCGMGYTK